MLGRIIICITSSVDEGVIDHIKEKVAQVFHVDVVKGQNILIDKKAYDRDREQYLTYPIFQDLDEIKRRPHDLLLAVVDVDLFIPELDYIFGQAKSKLKIAMISIKRLDPAFLGEKDKELLKERTLKESIHEIGHLLGSKHCPNRNCVMHFSNCLEDTDRKGFGFCTGCEMRL
ncbi:MAG: archaemetzincin family Zn-dependent metalloprotease [Candidatus Thermoplasmatota archaeon]|nr:archaemetzincin family Zn-dependent metalloprotease [Candidatus Thermoplasmatota archaeon]